MCSSKETQRRGRSKSGQRPCARSRLGGSLVRAAPARRVHWDPTVVPSARQDDRTAPGIGSFPFLITAVAMREDRCPCGAPFLSRSSRDAVRKGAPFFYSLSLFFLFLYSQSQGGLLHYSHPHSEQTPRSHDETIMRECARPQKLIHPDDKIVMETKKEGNNVFHSN